MLKVEDVQLRYLAWQSKLQILDASNDDGKAQAFIDSNNWEFFVNAAATYGFMVDKNVPWRLVADIGSSPMIEYATRHRFFSTDEVLLFAYQKAHSSYYTDI